MYTTICIQLYVCMYACMHACLSVYLSIHLSIYMGRERERERERDRERESGREREPAQYYSSHPNEDNMRLPYGLSAAYSDLFVGVGGAWLAGQYWEL